MTEWWRSWHGGPMDPKWLVVGKRTGVAPGIVSGIVWALLDHASQAHPRGSVSKFDVETYAIFSGFDEETIAAVIQALADKHVLTEEGMFVAWDERQPAREDSSAKRTRNWRQKNKENGHDPDPPVTQRVTPRDAPVTQGDAPEKNRTDKESPHGLSDSDSDPKTASGPQGAAAFGGKGEPRSEAVRIVEAAQLGDDASGVIIGRIGNSRLVPHPVEYAQTCVANAVRKRAGKRRAKPEAAAPPAQVFVIEGSTAWLAWAAARKKKYPRGIPVTDEPGTNRRGWYFETEFPPQQEARA